MKKYFIKTINIFLLSAVFFMAGGFCFSDLHSLVIKKNTVNAATLTYQASGMDNCGAEETGLLNNKINNQAPQPLLPNVEADQHNSILPCCLGDGQLAFNLFSQSFEIIKFIPPIFFEDNQITKTVVETVTYNTPLIPPPELLALKSNILRI